MSQGGPADRVLVLLRGRVKVTRVDAEGRNLVLAVRGPGELLGEMAVPDGNVRSATITTIDPCGVRVIPVDRFLALVDTMKLGNLLLRHAFTRLREGEELRSELASLPAGQRTVRGLLRLALPEASPRAPGEIDVGLDQTELGRAIGLSRGTVAAELRPLRDQGLIDTKRGHVVILDLGELRRLLVE